MHHNNGTSEILYKKTFIDSWTAFSTMFDFISLSLEKKIILHTLST